MTNNNNSSLEFNESLKIFRAEKAPKNQKDFYLKSFELFSKLLQHQRHQTLEQPVEDIIWEYDNLCLTYEPKSQWTKTWDLCQILYFSKDDAELYDSLFDWLDEYEPNESLESHVIRGHWDQAIELEQASPLKTVLEHLRDNQPVYLDNTTSNTQLDSIHRIISGDYNQGSLAERVLATVRFSRPGMPRNELHTLAQRKQLGADEVEDYLWMGMVDSALAKSNDLWLQTHLGHALIALDIKIPETFQLANEVIVDPVYLSMYEYVVEILKEGLWKEAIVYLSLCKEKGQDWIKELFDVPAFKESSNEYINEVLEVAGEHNLKQTQQLLHTILGKRYEDQGNTENAVIEYAKANDIGDLDRIAQDTFIQYLEKGILKNVVTDMKQVENSSGYAFLVNYQKFLTHLNQKEFKEASDLFSHMMTLNLPDQFDVVLMVDNDLVLEDRNVYYNEEQCLNLIQLFKAMEKDKSKRELAHIYYNRSRSDTLSTDLIWTKLRERLAYKAALSQIQ